MKETSSQPCHTVLSAGYSICPLQNYKGIELKSVSLAFICQVGFHALSMSKVKGARDQLAREVSWAGGLAYTCTAA